MTRSFFQYFVPEWAHRNRIPSGIYLKVKITNDPASYLKVEFFHDLEAGKYRGNQIDPVTNNVLWMVGKVCILVLASSPHQ